jgi:N-acyl-D-amino-acid deacylase
MRRRLRDAGARGRIRAELAAGAGREFDPTTILISFVPAGPNKRFEGLMLTEIGAALGCEPVDAALALLEQEGGGIQQVIFGMSEDDVRRVMRHPAVAVASDGWTLDPAAGGRPHPRSYGTYARVLGRYVRDEGVLSLEEAVRKMTSLPAQRLRCFDRGLIRPGAAADLVAFDPDGVADVATFQAPHQFCAGVDWVVVNGQVVIDGGRDTGAGAGRMLRRPAGASARTSA